jgi:ribosomal protein L31E
VSAEAPLITIRITNVPAIVEKEKGWFVANVVGAVVDLESKVEDVIIEKLKASLSEQGIEAVIERVVVKVLLDETHQPTDA